MIKMSDINLTVTTGAQIYIDIDIFRFIKDEALNIVEIQMDNNDGGYEFFLEINDLEDIIVDHDDLRKFAINWIFKNVEITNELGE